MKLVPIKIFGRDTNIKHFNSDKDVLIPEKYVEKDSELRGVWVSTVANIDVPKMELDENGNIKAGEVEKYKEYLDSIIATLKEYHLNTAVFQVRPVNDALYESKMNPWSSVLTGKEGLNPSFDVFGYFMEKAEKNGISVHAWINPYRAGRVNIVEKGMTRDEFLSTLGENNFARLHPECTILTKDNKILLDPANEVVREFVSDSIIEVATKYPVKAVHIDDYFYPYEDIADPDEEEKMKKAGFTKVSDFRRNNVDLMIELIHNKLSKLDHKVEFGISPFGIYRTKRDNYSKEDLETLKGQEASWEYGSNNHKGCLTNYAGLYADIYKWMEKGWIDYVAPQDYFDMENSKINDKGEEVCLVKYADLVDWWSWAAKKTKCKLYIGQAMYRMGGDNFWKNPYEISNQLKYNQNFDNVSGTIFFTYRDMVRSDNEVLKEARDILKTMWTKDIQDK